MSTYSQGWLDLVQRFSRHRPVSGS